MAFAAQNAIRLASARYFTCGSIRAPYGDAARFCPALSLSFFLNRWIQTIETLL